MRNTAKIAAAGACSLALAALLASPSFADSRPRSETDRHPGSTGTRDSRGSRQAAPRSEGRSDRGSDHRPADVDRRRSASPAPQWNSRDRAPRTLPPRSEERARTRSAPQPVPQWQNPPRDSRVDRDRDRWRPAPQEHSPRVAPDNRDPRWRPDSRYDSRQDSRQRSEPRYDSRQDSRQRPDTRYDSRQDSRQRSEPRYDSRQDSRQRPDSRYDSRQDSRWQAGSRWDSRQDSRWQAGTRYDDRRDYGRHDSSRRMSFEGRVQRLERGHGGYHFWLDNCREPFWIPDARFLLWPLRVGLSITFGGYWDSAGYYSVYDSAPFGDSYYYGSRPYGGSYYYGSRPYGSPYYYGSRPYGGSYYASQLLQGVVAGFDDRTGTLAVRDDRTGNYVNVVLRSNDLGLGDLRAGDWVSLSGTWDRDGYFEAYRVEDLRQR